MTTLSRERVFTVNADNPTLSGPVAVAVQKLIEEQVGGAVTTAYLASQLAGVAKKAEVYDKAAADQKVAAAAAAVRSDLETEAARAQSAEFTIETALATLADRRDNPHQVTKAQVGLSAAENTSDMAKPVSMAQQTAIDTARDLAKAASLPKTGGVLEGQLILPADPTHAMGAVTKQYAEALFAKLTAASPEELNTFLEVFEKFKITDNVLNALSASIAGRQPLDDDLTAIAGLGVTPFGQSLLTIANAADLRVAAGLNLIDNTPDLGKPISTATQSALTVHSTDITALQAALAAFAARRDNPNVVTKAQVGLGAVDNIAAAQLRDRSTHTGTQPVTSILDLAEFIQDTVGGMLVSGGAITLAYDDAGNKLTVNAPIDPGTDQEVVRDTVGAAVVGVQGVTVAINDAADTLTIGISGLTISQVTGLQTALDAKASSVALANEVTRASNAESANRNTMLSLSLPSAPGPASGPLTASVTNVVTTAGPFSDPDPAAVVGAFPQGFAIRNDGTSVIDLTWRQPDGTVRTSKILPGELRMFRQETTAGYAQLPGFYPLSQLDLRFAAPLKKANITALAGPTYLALAPTSTRSEVHAVGLDKPTTAIVLPKGVAAADGLAVLRLRFYFTNNGGGTKDLTWVNTAGDAVPWDTNGATVLGAMDGNTMTVEAVSLDGGTTWGLSGPLKVLLLGETSSTAYPGDKGKKATDDLAAHAGGMDNPHKVTLAQVNSQGTSDATKTYTIQQVKDSYALKGDYAASNDPRLVGRAVPVPANGYLASYSIVSTGNSAHAASAAYFLPSDVATTTSFRGLAVQVGTFQVGGAATTTLGLYPSLADGSPNLDALLGSVVVDPTVTTPNLKAADFAAALSLPAGRYWTCLLYVVTTAPSTAPIFNTKNSGLPVYGSSGAALSTCAIITGLSALPTKDNQSALAGGNNNAPIVLMRKAA